MTPAGTGMFNLIRLFCMCTLYTLTEKKMLQLICCGSAVMNSKLL